VAENTRGLLIIEETERRQGDQMLSSTMFQRQPLAQEDPTLPLDQNLSQGSLATFYILV